jgi:nucleoside-diphosphate-sugar epimerase
VGASLSEGAVLVLGGTGFIGSHLVERLASEGRRVIVASRRGTWPWGPAPRDVDLVALDLTAADAEAALARPLEGASAVVNLAGKLGRPGIARGVYDDLHAAGTARLAAAAAKRAGASGNGPHPFRILHVSTTGVLGPTGPSPRDESAAPAPVTPYETSKLEGERTALAARAPGLEVVIVRPGLVYGPRDVHLAPLYRAIARRTFRTIAGGRALWQPIFVDDMARAIGLALDARGCDGGVFHVAGAERLGVGALADRIAAKLGTRIHRPGLPYAGAMAAGAILETFCGPLGIDPPLSRARVRTMTEHRVYTIELARERLGFTPRIGLDEGIGRAIDWYRSHGYL